MIGRQREIATLWHQIELARAGALRVALLAGEPGIGKTHLLREMARRAATEGITVLRGGASDAEGMPPYLPFLDALGRYIRAADTATLHAQAGAFSAEGRFGGRSPPKKPQIRMFARACGPAAPLASKPAVS